jgi:hypothetical protein
MCGRFTSIQRLEAPGRSFEVAGPECIWMLHLDRVRTQLSPYNLDPGAIVYRLS